MSLSRYIVVALTPVLLLLAIQNTILPLWRSESVASKSSIAVVFAATSHFSHIEKVVPFAEGLAKRGYPVHFVTGKDFENTVDTSIVSFEPLDGAAGMVADEIFQKFLSMSHDEGMMYLANEVFAGRIADGEATLQRLFGRLKKAGHTVAYIHDQAFMGFLPQQLGKEGIRPAISLALGIAPIPFSSNDTYPFQSLKLPDTSPDRRAIHHQANLESTQTPENVAFNKGLAEKLSEVGVTKPHPGFWDSMGSLDEYLLQIGLPEFEYERTDLNPKLVFLGAPAKTGGDRTLPSWWSDIAAAKAAGKSIIVVSQGSAFPDLQALLVPTLKALAGRDDVLVIGTTVIAEPEEVPGLEVPANARIAKFIPFDLLLPEASLLICAGGYGTVIQAIAAGVPMIHAGEVSDKAHIGVLAEYKGISVNLKTSTPTTEQIVNGVNTVLGDGADQKPNASYLNNIQAMSKKLSRYNPIQRMEEAMLEAVKNAKTR